MIHSRIFRNELLFTLILLLCVQANFSAQGFQNYGQLQNLIVNPCTGYNGNGMSFYDFDNDGWDDLSFAVPNDSLKFYRNNLGSFEPVQLSVGNLGDAKHVVWVDFDNDGDADLMVSSSLSQTRLFENTGNLELVDITESCGIQLSNDHETYGCSWSDYDKDGYLDFYLNNYHAGTIGDPSENFLYRNNGDGTFTDETSSAGVGNGIQQSFQSIWFDYNNDSWPDLYVINDRLFMPNALYKNNGDGTFDDVSEDSGTDVLLYAMSATSGDYDNDGDLDLYVTNGSTGNVFLNNNGDGTFSDVTFITQTAVNEQCWAANWLDVNNDMLQDLYVSIWQSGFENGQNFFFLNTGTNPMTNANNQNFTNDDLQGYTNVTGDVNNDGYPDLAMYNDHVDYASLWLNNASAENNFIKILLEGQVSNRDGISSWINVYTDTITQSRYTYCGEDYLAQDSQREIVGLGNYSSIDSLKVNWLSGHEDVFYDVEANQTLHILEGSSLQNEIVYEDLPSFCTGDSLQLYAGEFSSYEWSTGDTSSTIWASTEGDYSVTVYTDFNIPITSSVLEVNELDEPIGEVSSNGLLCYGESIGQAWVENIGETGIQEVVWNNEQTGDTLYSLTAGIYSCILTDLNGCTSYTEFEIYQTEEIIVEVETIDVLCFGDSTGSATLTVSGGLGDVTIDWNGNDNENLSAEEYSVEVTDGVLCSVSTNYEINQPDSLSLSLDISDANGGNLGNATITISGGTTPYNILWSTNEDGETIGNLTQGEYSITITDFNGCEETLDFSILNLGVNEYNSAFLIYPNPSQGEVHISSQINLESFELILTDSKGAMIFKLPAKPTLDINYLSKGTYTLTLLKEDQVILRSKIIKE